jgi:hypothetical protein
MWENIYKSAVKLKEMALPQKMKVSNIQNYGLLKRHLIGKFALSLFFH